MSKIELFCLFQCIELIKHLKCVKLFLFIKESLPSANNSRNSAQGGATSWRLSVHWSTHQCLFLGSFAKFRKATISFVTSVRLSAWNTSIPTRRIFTKFNIWVFIENLSIKFKLHSNRTRITATLHEDQYSVLVISRSFLFRRWNVSGKRCRENQNTNFMFNSIFSKLVPFMGCGKIR